jgi:hypothetical protein
LVFDRGYYVELPPVEGAGGARCVGPQLLDGQW